MFQSAAQSGGFVAGIVIGLILVVFLFKFANINHRAKTQYDERQKEIRGQAYQYAFYTLIGFEVLMLLLEVCEIRIPMQNYLLHFAGILIGCIVLACYCIWHDVYWGLNNNRKRYALIFLAAAVLNAIPVIGALMHGGLMEDGVFTAAVLNVMVLIMMAVIGIMLLIKHFADRSEVES